jgi:hypothetical protein
VSAISGGGTIGNTNEGTLTDTMWYGGAWINACRFQAASNMTVTTMFAKVGAISGYYKCAIYTDSSGRPNQLLGSAAEVSKPASGWQSFPLTTSVALTQGSYYWLAIWSDNTSGRVYYSNTAGALRWGKYSYGAWPDPISTTGGSSLTYCIYATGTGATLTSITVVPANPNILPGATQPFTATGTYSDGSTQNITSQATWASSSTAVASINSSGLATGVTAGITTISAMLGSVSGNTTLTIQPPPLAITTTSLPSGTVSTAYTTTLAASGGITPYTWSLAGGALPPGLTLSSTGVITGTPTATVTSSFTVRATDASIPAQTATNLLSITINSAGTSGLIGNTNEGTLTDTMWDGGAWINACRFQAASNMVVSTMRAKVAAIPGKYKCAIYSHSSSQPSRLLGSTTEVSNPASGWQSFPLTSSLALTKGTYYWLAIWADDANARVYYSGNDGTLRWGRYTYGTWPDPISTTGGGSLNYCIYGTDTGATLTNITVAPANPNILAGATQSFTATGTYSDGSTQDITSQATWMSSNTGVATVTAGGLATGVSAGTTTISAAMSAVSGSTTLAVQAPLVVTTTSLPNGTVGTGYTTTLTASGGSPPYSWSLASGSLPWGLTLNATSGAITGTPTVARTSKLTVQASDASIPAKTATKPLSITIAVVPPPKISSCALSNSAVNLSWSTYPGKTYRVLYKDDLNATSWTPLGSDSVAPDYSLSGRDTNASSQQRFYRVVQVN